MFSVKGKYFLFLEIIITCNSTVYVVSQLNINVVKVP